MEIDTKEAIQMQSIHGVYTGTEIRPLETIHVRPNMHVIITFLDETIDIPENMELSETTPTQQFLEKCGGWQDDRSPDKIIAEIYDARTSSDRGAHAFQEATA
jgi:hypothetical protein